MENLVLIAPKTSSFKCQGMSCPKKDFSWCLPMHLVCINCKEYHYIKINVETGED